MPDLVEQEAEKAPKLLEQEHEPGVKKPNPKNNPTTGNAGGKW